MNYKDHLGIDVGCRSVKMKEVVTQREAEEIAAKVKRDQEQTKSTAIKKATFEALKKQVALGKLTPRQAEMIHHGAPLHIVFKK